MSEAGRLLGVDHGKVRVGLAVSDPDRRLASPLATYSRRSRDEDARFFQQVVAAESVEQIVVGHLAVSEHLLLVLVRHLRVHLLGQRLRRLARRNPHCPVVLQVHKRRGHLAPVAELQRALA